MWSHAASRDDGGQRLAPPAVSTRAHPPAGEDDRPVAQGAREGEVVEGAGESLARVPWRRSWRAAREL